MMNVLSNKKTPRLSKNIIDPRKLLLLRKFEASELFDSRKLYSRRNVR